jgi:shikimate dehydrogenase
MSVLLLGAGGAAWALAFALANAKVRRLAIANRTMDKAHELAERVAAAAPGINALATPADPTGHDLVINATSLGVGQGDGSPVPVEQLTPSMLVADIIMQPETPLLREARRRGCAVHPGHLMLDCQLEQRLAFLGLREPKR